MTPYSIVFCGTPDFAVPSLEALIADSSFSVDLVVTQPDKPVGRKQILSAPPVKVCAQKHDIRVVQPPSINKAKEMIDVRPDFLVVVAYGQILSDAILSIPNIMPVNVHASLLPRWRGASPIQHALIAGDSVTGVTVQRMVRALDAGAILSAKEIPIDLRETAQTLHDKMAIIGASLLIDTLKNPLKEREQNGDVSVCGKLSRADGIIDPQSVTAEEADRKVRAFVPWPGVRCAIDNHDIKLIETSLTETAESMPIQCAQGTVLHIVQLQPSGKKPMTGKDWERGHKTK